MIYYISLFHCYYFILTFEDKFSHMNRINFNFADSLKLVSLVDNYEAIRILLSHNLVRFLSCHVIFTFTFLRLQVAMVKAV